MDQEAIENLSSIQKLPWWIKKLSRSCRAAIEPDSQKPQWIEIAITTIEKRSSRGLIDSLAVERCWEAVEIAQKQFFKKEKYTNMNAIKHATQPKIQITFWTLQNIYQLEKCQEFRSKTHTHPKQVKPILCFKNKLIQFSEYTLTHVFFEMAKSYCTCTCIKSSKEYCMLCVKNITRLHKCLHVMTI